MVDAPCDFTDCDREAEKFTPAGRRFCQQHVNDCVAFGFLDREELTEL